MTEDQKLQKLIEFLDALNVNVKTDRGNFKGGLVRYYDETLFYLNRKMDTDAKIKLILSEIKNLNIPDDQISQDIKSILSESNS